MPRSRREIAALRPGLDTPARRFILDFMGSVPRRESIMIVDILAHPWANAYPSCYVENIQQQV